jgi:hypothetical protein
MRPIHVVPLIALAAALAAVFALSPRRQPPASPPAAPASTAAVPALQPRAATAAPPATQMPALTGADRELVRKLREKYGPHIRNQNAQVKLLEELLAYLESLGTPAALDRAYALLQALFPELADALFAKLQGLLHYDGWLQDNRGALNGLSSAERRLALWDARRAAFGADAEEIWAGELRSQQVNDALASLDTTQGRTLDEKMDVVLAAVQQAYGERAPDFLERRRTELLNGFLSVPAIQGDLHELPPPQQHAALRSIRARLGMDAPALERWDTLDAQRDRAWTAGQDYVFQREQIAAQFQGEERERRLHALQDQLFGEDADTIRSEEAAGFFRYAQARRIGQE